VTIPLHHDETFFNRHGPWVPWFTTLLLLAAAFTSTRKRQRTPSA
jgi:apolipoprotein N-acyltransferase